MSTVAGGLSHFQSTHFPTTSNPSSPTFPHSQSISLNGAGIALALRPGTSVSAQGSAAQVGGGGISAGGGAGMGSAGTGMGQGEQSYLEFVKGWDDEQVSRWLGEVNVPQYSETFKSNDIRGNVLLDVDQSALKEMGIRSVGDRVKITVAIKNLRSRCASSSSIYGSSSDRHSISSGSPKGSPTNFGTNSSGPSSFNGTFSSGSLGRRPGSGKGSGRIPPPLHLSQSTSTSDFPQAWQPPPTTSSSQRLGAPFSSYSATSPRTISPRPIPPPSLPPPRSQPPPPPPQTTPHRNNSRDSPESYPSGLPRQTPSISTTAASPTNTLDGRTNQTPVWTGEYGRRGNSTSPTRPSTTGTPGSSIQIGHLDRKSSLQNPIRPPMGIQPQRPSTSNASGVAGGVLPNQVGQHRKVGSITSTTGGIRPSTAQASLNYGHNQPLSTHPYAISTTSPTQEGFSVATYGRSPSGSNLKSLLPSPSISTVPSNSSSSALAPVLEMDSSRSSTPLQHHQQQLQQGYQVGRGGFARPTTPGGIVSASGPIPGSGGNASSLDAVMRKAIKFMSDDGVTKIVAVNDCGDGKEVLYRVLKKFGKIDGAGEDADDWGVFSTTADGQMKALSDVELFAICRDGLAPERQRGLTIRQLRPQTGASLSADSMKVGKKSRKLQWMFGEPSTPEGSSKAGGVVSTSPTGHYVHLDEPPASPTKDEHAEIVRILDLIEPFAGNSNTLSDKDNIVGGSKGKMNRASTISVMSGLGADWPQLKSPGGSSVSGPSGVGGPGSESQAIATRSPSSGSFLSSGRKLRNFFGQRPPSELIATHLTEYFPKAEKNKLLSKQVRQSMRRSMVRRDSFIGSANGGGTSWEKGGGGVAGTADRYSLSPAAMSRFSGSSGGSGKSFGVLPPSNAAPGDKDYPSTPPRLGGARTSDDSTRSRNLLEPPDESAEDDDDDDSSFSHSNKRRSRRISNASSSRLSAYSRSKDSSDNASMITVDEVTAELEERRASLASYMDSDEESIIDIGGGLLRPPSISVAGEDTDGESEEDEDLSEEDEDEDEEDEAPAETSKPALKWIKGALIGAGSFGSVYLGMNPSSGSLMAVKQVELPTGNSHNEEKKKSMLDALEREIELLKVLQHENIVQYLDSSSDATHLNIFLEYVPGGSVAALLSNYGAFEEALVSKFVRQILTGLDYLHEREIIHRDIKGANILVDNKGGIKISDFGISKKVEDNLLTGAKVHRPSLQGSVYWMAPEVVKQTAYTSKADIWSLGCLVVEMLTGVHPWANLTQMQAIFRIGSSVRPAIPDDISSDADDFLDKTFNLDYEERPSAKSLLGHLFIRDKDKDREVDGKELQTPTRATFSQSGSPVKDV